MVVTKNPLIKTEYSYKLMKKIVHLAVQFNAYRIISFFLLESKRNLKKNGARVYSV